MRFTTIQNAKIGESDESTFQLVATALVKTNVSNISVSIVKETFTDTKASFYCTSGQVDALYDNDWNDDEFCNTFDSIQKAKAWLKQTVDAYISEYE